MNTSECKLCKEVKELSLSCCDKCGMGICRDCSTKISEARYEALQRFKKQCLYCNDGQYDKLCHECRSYVNDIIKSAKHGSNPYEIAKRFNCDCSPNCKCRNQSRDFVNKKYHLDLLPVLYEYYDEPTDYCLTSCEKCLTTENRRCMQNVMRY